MMSSPLSKNSKVRLTSAGKDLHDNGRLDGTQSGEVLVYLNDNGASRIFDISDFVNSSDNAIKSTVSKLIRSGYIELENEASEENVSEEEDFE